VYTADRYNLWRIATDGSRSEALYSNLKNVLVFDFDIENQQVFMVSNRERRIYQTNVHGNASLHHVLALDHSSNGIAVDWVNRKMYWTDITYKRILVAELDGSKKSVLIEKGLGNPRAIAVDPIRG